MSQLKYGLIFVGLTVMPCVLLLYFYADHIVALLFQRGTFGEAELINVTSTLSALAPGMAAMLLGVFLFRALFCLKGTAVVTACLGLVWGVLYFALSALMLNEGAVGIAHAYTVSWFIVASLIAIYTIIAVRGADWNVNEKNL